MPSSDSATPSQITEQQLKHCASIITKMKRNSSAGPFLQPVDPVALNILDYPEKIKHPMDISTIKHKLDTKVYKTPEEFNSDVELMFNNCYSYNPPDTPVHIMGRELQSFYVNLYAEMPKSQKRKETAQEKPKKQAKKGGLPPEEHSRCTEVLAELERPANKEFIGIFSHPVSEEEAPDYYKIIKNPMDLETVHKKLSGNKYTLFQEFVDDLQIIVSNCFEYNAPGTVIHKYGMELERAINDVLSKKGIQQRGENDIRAQIADKRQRISELTAELRELEAKIGPKKHAFTISDRERIGQHIVNSERPQMEKIAEIVQRHGVYEYIDPDEIEINLQTIPDSVLVEIDDCIRKSQNFADSVSTVSSEE